MRLSTLALLIALPAAAYAAATGTTPDNNNNNQVSNQPATNANTVAPADTGSCIQQTQACSLTSGPACCNGSECKFSNGVQVRFIAHLLRFTLCTEPIAAMHPTAELGLSRKRDTVDTRPDIVTDNVQVMVMMQGTNAFRRHTYCTHWTCGCGVLCSTCLLNVN